MNDSVKVLLIEDNPGDARLIRELLAEQRDGLFRLECVDHLSAGIKRLASGKVDVILLDLGLPDSQGFDTFIKVRNSVPQIPTVILSGLTDEALAARAVRDGAQDYLVKGHVDCNLLGCSLRYAIERKQVEEALRKSEAKYRQLVESMGEGLWVIDADGKTTFINPRMAEILGYTVDDMLGEYLFSFMDEPGIELARRNLERRSQGIREQHDFEFLRKDGKRIYTILETNVITDASGNYTGAVACVTDVTERKKAEEALRASEENFRNSVNNSPLGIRIVTADGETLYANRALLNIYGYGSLEELKAISRRERYTPESYTQHLERREKRRRGEFVPSKYEMRIVRKDGEVRHLLASREEVLWNGEKQFLMVYQDITERERAEQKERELRVLKEIDKLRSQFLSNASHELRTPLTSIKGFISTLLRTDVKWSEEEQRDFLETMNQEADRLTRLINDLLDISRLDAGGLKLNKSSHHISEIIGSIGDRLAILTQRHQLELKFQSGLPTVLVDEMRISQVVTNLIENAAKFSPEGSKITIEAYLAGDQVVVSVIDRGVGIPTELQNKLFDRFYQAENVVTGRKKGTGLGLSICRGLVEAHAGRIWAESKPGEGSKFSFGLPVSKREEQVA